MSGKRPVATSPTSIPECRQMPSGTLPPTPLRQPAITRPIVKFRDPSASSVAPPERIRLKPADSTVTHPIGRIDASAQSLVRPQVAQPRTGSLQFTLGKAHDRLYSFSSKSYAERSVFL